jgi:glycosyltransferase involved in cell wall biosynthesis
MKIAYIYDAIYPWVKGGVERRIYEIAKRLANKGHEIHWYGIGWWLDNDDSYNNRVIKHENITLHSVCGPMTLYVNGKRNINEALVFSGKLFLKLIKESKESFDVIDCQEFPYLPCFVAKTHSLLRRAQLVITWHEIWDKYWFEYLGKKGLFGWIVERLTLKLSCENVAVSKRVKSYIERVGVKNVKLIPNGVDFKQIVNVRPSREESDVVFAGRLIRDKNVDLLIKAIFYLKKEMPDIKCMIIGDGPEKTKLINLAEKLNIASNVKFVGFLENLDEVVSYMKSSKVFVSPSTREGFGMVVLEANACGLPVVTVNHERNAACELIDHGSNGFICKLSPEDIAEKILLGIEMKEVMREKCIEKARNYDWAKIVDSVELLYEGLL